MASSSPAPNSPSSVVSPTASTTPTPPGPPPATATPPSSTKPNANPPDPSTPSVPSPPNNNGTSPTPPVESSPPPTSSPPPAAIVPPPSSNSSPPPSPPVSSIPPPSSNAPPPPSTEPPASSPPPPSTEPPRNSPPPPSTEPPRNSPPPPPPPPPSTEPPPNSPPPPSTEPPRNSPPPPPPSADPPRNSPPPPSTDPPRNSPPPPPPPPSADPPRNSPPPPSTDPPRNSPPPPSTDPPLNSPPPPPSSKPPKNAPPPPSAKPPKNAPPPPESKPPKSSPPPPSASKPPVQSPPPPPPPASMPPSNSPPPPTTVPPSNSPPPPPSLNPPSALPPILSESPPSPPSLVSPPTFSPPSQIPNPPSGNPTDNNSTAGSPGTSNSSGGTGTGGAVAIGLVLGFILLGLIGTAAWYSRKRRKKNSGLNAGYVMPTSMGSSPKSESALLKTQASPSPGSVSGFVYPSTEQGGLGNSRSWFSYEALVAATNRFSDLNLLGEGGFGSVYKGCLPDGREIAVKQLKIGGGQGEREFRAEVEIISRIHHRHLVSLVGYCISDNRRLLVYDFVPNNTLYFHLHGEDRPVMDWTTRVKIAAGAARGIAYLHEDCHPRVIHRDIKSANILLDNNFDAQVSDFGLAKLALDAYSHVTTRVMGTFGYMAPEYASSGKLTEKSDVYSFGVVLLELITGRKPVDSSQPLGDESLVEWARPLLSHAIDTGEFDGLTDPRLERNYVASEMFRMVEAAAACVRHAAAKRPRMGQVVRAFDSIATSDLTNGMRVGESQVYNSAQQSAEIRLFRRMAFGSQDFSTSDFFSENNLNNC